MLARHPYNGPAMGPISVKVEIDLPRAQVFEAISDLARRPSFTEPYQTDYRLERLQSAGVGAAARFRTLGGAEWMDTEIVEMQSPHRLVERGRGGRYNRVPNVTAWELVETPAGLTEVRLTFFTDPSSPFDRLSEWRRRAESRHRRGWQASLERLREGLESEQGIRPDPVRVAGRDRLPGLSTGTLAAI